ncbi:MAG: PAS domain S-box protein, partial [Proteobacteria bacterium]
SNTGRGGTFEQHITTGATSQWLKVTATPQDEQLVVTLDIGGVATFSPDVASIVENAEKQQRLYDSITNNTPDLIYVFDLDYKFTYANKALLTMWGKSAEDAIGKGLRDNGYEEWHALLHEREIDQVVATKLPVRGTVAFPHSELGTRIYDYILTPVLNEDNEVEVVSGTTRDITEAKRAEEKVQQSETRFRNMIEQSPVAMLLSRGDDFTIESINKPMLQFLGKNSPDEVLGKNMLDILPELSRQNSFEMLRQVQRTGEPFRGIEQPMDILVDGTLTRRYFDLSYDRIEEAHQSWAVLHIAVDVTEKVLSKQLIAESEARLRSVIQQTPAATLVLRGDNFEIAQINAMMLELIGMDDKVVGMPLLELMPELADQYIWEELLRVYEQGVDFEQSEVLVSHRRTGIMADYYYNIAYRPLVESGEITGMIQVAVDVTEQVNARKKIEESQRLYKHLSETLEQQVRERTQELQRSNDDLQQFAHVASHDLKEPVRKVKTFTARLEQHLN